MLRRINQGRRVDDHPSDRVFGRDHREAFGLFAFGVAVVFCAIDAEKRGRPSEHGAFCRAAERVAEKLDRLPFPAAPGSAGMLRAAIVWTRGGFTIVHKRLERGTFTFPSRVTGDATSVAIDVLELAMLLEGIDASGAKSKPRWEPPPRIRLKTS